MDDGDAVLAGTWTTGEAADARGGSLRILAAGQTGTATWTASSITPGHYRVLLAWNSSFGMADDATITVGTGSPGILVKDATLTSDGACARPRCVRSRLVRPGSVIRLGDRSGLRRRGADRCAEPRHDSDRERHRLGGPLGGSNVASQGGVAPMRLRTSHIPRGFTLIEMTLVGFLLVLLSFLMSRAWVAFGRPAISAVARARLIQEANLAAESLAHDVGRTRPTQRPGSDSRYQNVQDSGSTLYLAIDDGTGSVRTISYSIDAANPGKLFRADSGTKRVVASLVADFQTSRAFPAPGTGGLSGERYPGRPHASPPRLRSRPRWHLPQ